MLKTTCIAMKMRSPMFAKRLNFGEIGLHVGSHLEPIWLILGSFLRVDFRGQKWRGLFDENGWVGGMAGARRRGGRLRLQALCFCFGSDLPRPATSDEVRRIQ